MVLFRTAFCPFIGLLIFTLLLSISLTFFLHSIEAYFSSESVPLFLPFTILFSIAYLILSLSLSSFTYILCIALAFCLTYSRILLSHTAAPSRLYSSLLSSSLPALFFVEYFGYLINWYRTKSICNRATDQLNMF